MAYRAESRPASVAAATWPVASEARSSSDFVVSSDYTCSLPFFFFFCFLVEVRAAVGSSGVLVVADWDRVLTPIAFRPSAVPCTTVPLTW